MALEMGVISGVPMRPGEIQELMNQMNQSKVAHVFRPRTTAATTRRNR